MIWEPNAIHAENPSFMLSLFLFTPLVVFVYWVHSGDYTCLRVPPAPDLELRGEGICRQQVHIILRVTIALGSAGHIRDLSNGLDILRGGLDPSTTLT